MTGSFGRSGGNRRFVGKDGSKQDGGPVKPSGLSEQASSKWDELIGQLPHHELRRIDVHQLEILVGLVLEAKRLLEMLAANPADHPTRRLHLSTCQHISRLSSQFGLSPADRKRIDVEPEPEIDELEEFIRS
jgi:phage terminase small subunit